MQRISQHIRLDKVAGIQHAGQFQEILMSRFSCGTILCGWFCVVH